jgi:hypothetical protein
MRKIVGAIALCAGLVLAGCAGLQHKIDVATGVYKTATETTVPSEAVIPAANTFDILKAAATNYGAYCIQQKMAPAICSANTRRIVIRAVRAGTGARNQMEDSVVNGKPALASIYNVLVSAINSLKATPAATAQFGGA